MTSEWGTERKDLAIQVRLPEGFGVTIFETGSRQIRGRNLKDFDVYVSKGTGPNQPESKTVQNLTHNDPRLVGQLQEKADEAVREFLGG